jgi:branched-chain amino acid transport system substrate-binding protein
VTRKADVRERDQLRSAVEAGVGRALPMICRGNATRWTAALAAAALIAGCGSSASSSGSGSGSGSTAASGGTTLHKSTIVLGNIGTYSGPFGAQYADSLKGLQAWAQWTTAHGGLNGHPVKIVSIDDLGSTTNALAGAKRLVEADHAVAILDAMTPNTDSPMPRTCRASTYR